MNHINEKTEIFLQEFKEAIHAKVQELNIPHVEELMSFVYDYENLVFVKEDFSKRRALQQEQEQVDTRCTAKRACGKQCTRRKKNDSPFCGTHGKGQPHGILPPTDPNELNATMQSVELLTADIMGITYFIDRVGHVYKTEDILSKKQDPAVVANWEMVDGKYCIPSFGLTNRDRDAISSPVLGGPAPAVSR